MNKSIIDDLKDNYGVICKQITPVTGGWLNQKWKVSTKEQELLIKQFCKERYPGVKLSLLYAHSNGNLP